MLSKVLLSIVKSEQGGTRHKIEEEMDIATASQKMRIGDLCPERSEYGEAAVVNEEGCSLCWADLCKFLSDSAQRLSATNRVPQHQHPRVSSN